MLIDLALRELGERFVRLALYRGEHQVAKIVQIPSPEEEDDKRLLRSRANLLRDRIRHTNRIWGCSTCKRSGTSIPTGGIGKPRSSI